MKFWTSIKAMIKTMILLTGMFAGISAQATSSAFEAICADGVSAHPTKPGFWHFDRPHFAKGEDALYATMHLRPNEQGEYAVVRVDDAHKDIFVEVARFREPIRDIEFHSGAIWVLFANHLISLNASSGQTTLNIETSADSAAPFDFTAQAFVWVGDRLVIAHGAMGMMVFDERSQSITVRNYLGLNNDGQQSKAIDVTVNTDHQVIFAVEAMSVTNKAPFTFNGFIVVDLGAGSIGRYPYDRAVSGSLSNALIQADGDQIIINNWGILQIASLAAMKKEGRVTIQWLPVHFEINGHNEPGELMGEMLLDQGTILSCGHFSYQDQVSRKILHKGPVYQGKY